MKLRILGCSGGIGSGEQTTAMLLDDDVLIDAGTGVGDLSLDEMRRLLGLDGTAPADCARATAVVVEHLAHVRARMRELRALERELVSLRAACDGSATACGLLQALEGAAVAPVTRLRRRGHV